MNDWVRVRDKNGPLQKVVGDYMATIREANGMTLAEVSRLGSHRVAATIRFASPDAAITGTDSLLQALAF